MGWRRGGGGRKKRRRTVSPVHNLSPSPPLASINYCQTRASLNRCCEISFYFFWVVFFFFPLAPLPSRRTSHVQLCARSAADCRRCPLQIAPAAKTISMEQLIKKRSRDCRPLLWPPPLPALADGCRRTNVGFLGGGGVNVGDSSFELDYKKKKKTKN